MFGVNNKVNKCEKSVLTTVQTPWDQDVFSLVGAMLPECLRKIGQKWINIYFIEHFGANSGSPAKSLLTGDGPRQTCTHPYDT